jgi:uncharacterized protein (TIGR02246 family)
MRRGFGLAAALAALVVAGAVRAAPPSAAEAKVRAAFESYDQGWRQFDVDKVTDAFADDFEWTNEVGLRFTDKAKLRRFLTHLFADADFRAGKDGPLVVRSIRFPGPNVAVVSSSEETDGQVDSATGKVVKVLHANELTVMSRQGGRWRIVSDLTSDESHGI